MSDLMQEIANGMNARLDGGGIATSIGLSITDQGRVLVDTAGARVSEDPADCEISMKQKTFEGLVSGKVNPMTATMMGKIKLRGDMSAALSLSKLLG